PSTHAGLLPAQTPALFAHSPELLSAPPSALRSASPLQSLSFRSQLVSIVSKPGALHTPGWPPEQTRVAPTQTPVLGQAPPVMGASSAVPSQSLSRPSQSVSESSKNGPYDAAVQVA